MLNQTWFRPLLILFLGFSAYSFMLGAPFKTLDDQFSIVSNKSIQDNRHFKEIFTQGYFKDRSYYRPLVNLSFMVEYQVFGLKPIFYYLDNLALHFLNTFLVWTLVSLITGSSTIGFWVGLLFVIHPIHVEAVSNISGRAILLSGTFILTSFICFLLYEQKGKGRFLWFSILTFCLGLLCKESSAVLPAVILLYLWLQKKDVKKIWPLWVIVGLYILLRKILQITQIYTWRDLNEYVLGFVTFLRSAITDLRLVFFPTDLHFDRSQRLILSLGNIEFWVTILFWIALVIGLWYNRHRIKTLVWFALGWLIFEMFPVSQIVTTIGVSPGVISCADHFLYLASIPVFMILVGLSIYIWGINQQTKFVDVKIFKTVVGAFLVFLFLVNIEQNMYASNEFAMINRSVQIQPYNARMQSSLGLIYAQKGRFPEAQEHFMLAMAADPANPRYKISLAKSICDQGQYQECMDIYNQISDPGPFKELLEENKKMTQGLMTQNVQILPK